MTSCVATPDCRAIIYGTQSGIIFVQKCNPLPEKVRYEKVCWKLLKFFVGQMIIAAKKLRMTVYRKIFRCKLLVLTTSKLAPRMVQYIFTTNTTIDTTSIERLSRGQRELIIVAIVNSVVHWNERQLVIERKRVRPPEPHVTYSMAERNRRFALKLASGSNYSLHRAQRHAWVTVDSMRYLRRLSVH